MSHGSAYTVVLVMHESVVKGNFGVSELRNLRTDFSQSRVFKATAEWVPIGLGYRRLDQKTRTMGLPDRESSSTISLAVWIRILNY